MSKNCIQKDQESQIPNDPRDLYLDMNSPKAELAIETASLDFGTSPQGVELYKSLDVMISSTETCNDGVSDVGITRHYTYFAKVHAKKTYGEFIKWSKSQHPMMLMILFVMSLTVVVSGAIVFFVFTGALTNSYTETQLFWMGEVNYQILNACFTIACIYVFPDRCINAYNFIVVNYKIGSDESRAIYYKDLETKFPWAFTVSSHHHNTPPPSPLERLSASDQSLMPPVCHVLTNVNKHHEHDLENSLQVSSSITCSYTEYEDNYIKMNRTGPNSIDYKLTWHWFNLRCLLYVGVLHCCLQFISAGYMLFYTAYTRPSYYIGIVVPTIVIGCLWGAWEGYMRNSNPKK